MNWKQTIGLVISVGAIVALCFLVIFPALHDKEDLQSNSLQSESGESQEEERSVLPKLKGVNWETSPQSENGTVDIKKKTKAKKEPSRVATKSITREPVRPVPARKAPAPILELQEMVWFEEAGFVVVTGTVKNISSQNLPTVQANVTFEGEGAWFISEEHAMIDLNPLFPDQLSSFTVVSRYYPEITNAVIDFRRFSGESIPWRKSVALVEAIENATTADGELPVDEAHVVPADEVAEPQP